MISAAFGGALFFLLCGGGEVLAVTLVYVMGGRISVSVHGAWLFLPPGLRLRRQALVHGAVAFSFHGAFFMETCCSKCQLEC